MISASPAASSRGGSVRSVVGVGEHGDRLVKRADHVLRARVVHGGLAADGGVDLCEQRRRNLHEVDAALEASRGITRHVADHAAAERDEARSRDENARRRAGR